MYDRVSEGYNPQNINKELKPVKKSGRFPNTWAECDWCDKVMVVCIMTGMIGLMYQVALMIYGSIV